uniref:Uncharacterized protein n=1 Tax=Panagrolaimus sp. PS1159 TaxID=55785 RepID=A0AC35FIS2_9BILA
MTTSNIIGFCPHAETIDDYATRIELYGDIYKLTREQKQKLFNDGIPNNYSDQFKIDVANTSLTNSKMDGSVFTENSTTKKPKKLSDFVHSIFLMFAFLTVLILFVRHFSMEAAENQNNIDGSVDE